MTFKVLQFVNGLLKINARTHCLSVSNYFCLTLYFYA